MILVGQSYGGMVITGVAEAVPERLGHIVYVDAFVPLDGECVMSVGGRSECGSVEAVEGQVDGLLAPRWVEPGTPPPSDVPHPVRTLSTDHSAWLRVRRDSPSCTCAPEERITCSILLAFSMVPCGPPCGRDPHP